MSVPLKKKKKNPYLLIEKTFFCCTTLKNSFSVHLFPHPTVSTPLVLIFASLFILLFNASDCLPFFCFHQPSNSQPALHCSSCLRTICQSRYWIYKTCSVVIEPFFFALLFMLHADISWRTLTQFHLISPCWSTCSRTNFIDISLEFFCFSSTDLLHFQGCLSQTYLESVSNNKIDA